MKYKFLRHTADAKFQSFGKTLEEAFENAAYAMTDIITDHKKIKAKIKKAIKIKSENQEALLYDFLEQFLILLDTKGFLLRRISDMKISEKGKSLVLSAKVTGDKNFKIYPTKTTIKAVTYQEMFIKKSEKGWTVQVVVDI